MNIFDFVKITNNSDYKTTVEFDESICKIRTSLKNESEFFWMDIYINDQHGHSILDDCELSKYLKDYIKQLMVALLKRRINE